MALDNTIATTKKPSFGDYLLSTAVKSQIDQTLGAQEGMRFRSAIISAVSNNPTLSDCDFKSIISAAMVGEALKLSPSQTLGQYYIVPFEDRKNNRKVGTFQLGYKGYIQLAIRSGYYRKLNVVAIKEGELIKYDPINEVIEFKAIDDAAKRINSKTVGYYAMFEYHNGFYKPLYWPVSVMEAHALEYSQAFKRDKEKGWSYSFWTKDFDSMALKTMIRQLISKWGIMSIDMQKAFENDSFDSEATPTECPQDVDKVKETFFDVTNTATAAEVKPVTDAEGRLTIDGKPV